MAILGGVVYSPDEPLDVTFDPPFWAKLYRGKWPKKGPKTGFLGGPPLERFWAQKSPFLAFFEIFWTLESKF